MYSLATCRLLIPLCAIDEGVCSWAPKFVLWLVVFGVGKRFEPAGPGWWISSELRSVSYHEVPSDFGKELCNFLRLLCVASGSFQIIDL